MTVIRKMTEGDRAEVAEMMRVFYASPAVSTNGSDEIFKADIDACIGDSPYLEGYVFAEGGTIKGYGMLAKSFSTEFGRECIWIEDIYLKPEHRGGGLGTEFLRFVEEKYGGCLLRLELEEENERALRVYKSCGFDSLPYMEMKKLS